MKKLLLTAALLACAGAARAQTIDQINYAQGVTGSSGTITSTNVAANVMTQVDNPQLKGSYKVMIINHDSATAACCAFDSQATNAAGGGVRSCYQLDTYAVGKGSHDDSKWTIFRWWQNLKIYCMSLGPFPAEIRVIQER